MLNVAAQIAYTALNPLF